MTTLELQEISVRYGGVRAVSDVSLTVDDGQLVGLIGANGAGKTSLVDAITGFTKSSGKVLLDGNDISRCGPDERARVGLRRTWQAAELFADLSVRDNLRVAVSSHTAWETLKGVVAGRAYERPSVERAIELLNLGYLADRQTTDLSEGERKLVGVARALAAEPRVLCLDEPAAGLDTGESHRLGQQLRRIAHNGLGTLLIDHDMGLVLSVCDYIVVLEFGKIIARGTPEQVRADERVIESYLGASATHLDSPEASGDPGATATSEGASHA